MKYAEEDEDIPLTEEEQDAIDLWVEEQWRRDLNSFQDDDRRAVNEAKRILKDQEEKF